MISNFLWQDSLIQRFFARFKEVALRLAAAGSTSVAESIGSQENNYTMIRLVLATSVIYYHSFALTYNRTAVDRLNQALLPTISVGDLAVQGFFFLSGLFVTQSFFRDRNPLHFFTKRLFRVWPGLFVCLVVTATISVLLSNPGHIFQYLEFSGLYDYILSNARFISSWSIPGIFSGMPFDAINGSIHTLPQEMKMYAVLTLVGTMGLLSRRYLIVVCGIVLLSVVIWWPDNHLVAMAVESDASARMAAVMFFAGVVMYGIAKYFAPCLWHGLVLGTVALSTSGVFHILFFYLFVIWSIVYIGQSSLIRKFISPRQDLSYGIYIYGWPCQQFVVFATSSHINPYILAIASLVLSSGFAFFSWRWIEKPSIDLGHWLVSNGYRVHSKNAWQLLAGRVPVLRVFFILGLLLSVCVGMQWWTYSDPSLGRSSPIQGK